MIFNLPQKQKPIKTLAHRYTHNISSTFNQTLSVFLGEAQE